MRRVGIVPDQGRGLAYGTAFLLSFLHIVAKAFSTALLAVSSPTVLGLYLLADHGLHITYRVFRRDLIFYFPMPSLVSYPFSFLIRVVEKTIVDFSGSLQFRLPSNLGGSYFFFNLVTSQISLLVAVHVYNTSVEDDGDGTKKDAKVLWRIFGSMNATWLIVMGFFFFRVAVPSHRHTLWSTVSQRQWVQAFFLENEEDSDKIGIFGCNKLLWESDIGAEVMEWTRAHWAEWTREKPEWFTLFIIATVPDEYIPAEHLIGLGGAKRQRRGSAVESVRESVRRMSLEEEEEKVDVT